MVLLSPYFANHDLRAFPESCWFDLRHYVNGTARPHLAFGHGPHYCLGAALARMELQESIRALVERLPGRRSA